MYEPMYDSAMEQEIAQLAAMGMGAVVLAGGLLAALAVLSAAVTLWRVR